jgi:hypothetical protein
MRRPLGLPVGSVRAILLLALAARAVLELRTGALPAAWLLAALAFAAAAYFSARGASPREVGPTPEGAVRPTPPLGLPAGSVRTLFLLALAYGAFLWVKDRDLSREDLPILIVSVAFFVGVLGRWVLTKARTPADPGTARFDHLQALAALAAAGGLVALAALDRSGSLAWWIEPSLAAFVVYYFGVR